MRSKKVFGGKPLGIGIVFLAAGLSISSLRGEASSKERLLAPFHAGGNDGLNNLILIPTMESAVTNGKNSLEFGISTEIIDNGFQQISGISSVNVNGETYESHARVVWGALDYLDLSADGSFTAYGGGVNAVSRGESFFNKVEADREITDPVFQAKFQFWGGEREGTGLAARLAFKAPVGDDRDVHSTGAFDFAGGLLGTLDTDSGVFHANVNYTIVGDQEIFRSQANIDLQNTVSFGLGYMFEWKLNRVAIGAQVFGYVNPYRDTDGNLDGFDGPPVSLLLGGRWYPYRSLSLEFAGGPGITSDAADLSIFLNLVYQR